VELQRFRRNSNLQRFRRRSHLKRVSKGGSAFAAGLQGCSAFAATSTCSASAAALLSTQLRMISEAVLAPLLQWQRLSPPHPYNSELETYVWMLCNNKKKQITQSVHTWIR
jgi:hypothetical protein